MRSTFSSPSSRRPVWIACSKRFIAIWRKTVGDGVVDPADEQVEQRARIVLALLQLLEGERLGEDGRGLGERQRRARVQQPESCASAPWSPCPSSCASVRTLRRSPA